MTEEQVEKLSIEERITKAVFFINCGELSDFIWILDMNNGKTNLRSAERFKTRKEAEFDLEKRNFEFKKAFGKNLWEA